MGYVEAYRFIYSLKRFGGSRGLEAIRRSLLSTGNPHLRFPSIHIAGTNGKGSVSAILSSVLRASGLKVGLYTSPHLMRVNERIRINGTEIDDETFSSGVEELSGVIRRDDLSFFEALTLLAFKVFDSSRIDIGVIETGLGGRLDATNLLRPLLSIITNIGHDHTGVLGSDLLSIAREKLGILKAGVPFVTGVEGDELRDLFISSAREKDVPLFFLDDGVRYTLLGLALDGTSFEYSSPVRSSERFVLPLIGSHQARNAALAVMALDHIDSLRATSDDNIRVGLGEVSLPGRFQIEERDGHILVFDVFHNCHGARVVRKTLSELFPGRRVSLLVGMSADKDAAEIAREFSAMLDRVITVKPQFAAMDRDVGPADLAPVFSEAGLRVTEARTIGAGLVEAETNMSKGDVLLVGGSFRTVAQALALHPRS